MSLHSDSHAALQRVVHEVRRRWRVRRGLNGAAIALALSALIFLVTSNIIGRGTPDETAVLVARVIVALTTLAALAWFALRPLLRRVSDERVALYIEEHEPSLKAALLGAVEVSGANNQMADLSPAIIDRLIRTAVEKCRDIDFGMRIERPRLMKSGGLFGIAILAIALFFAIAPTTVRHGAARLLLPRGKAAATPLFSIAVRPGNDTVARGADVNLNAELGGFTSDKVELLVKLGGDTEFKRWPMVGDGKGAFEFVLFDIAQPAEYMVESEGIRSPRYRLTVVDLPYVKTMRLEYIFPVYTFKQ